MAYKKVETGQWTPEKEDDFIEGILLNKESNVGANDSMLYTIDVDEKPTGVWGCAVLDPKMLGVTIGDKVKIVYLGLGEAKSGKKAPKLFDVYVDRKEDDNINPVPEKVGQ